MTIYERVNQGVYEPAAPTPPKEPAVLRKAYKNMTDEERDTVASVAIDYQRAFAAYSEALLAHHRAISECAAKFRADVEAEFNTTGNPKADLLWDKVSSKAGGDQFQILD